MPAPKDPNDSRFASKQPMPQTVDDKAFTPPPWPKDARVVGAMVAAIDRGMRQVLAGEGEDGEVVMARIFGRK